MRFELATQHPGFSLSLSLLVLKHFLRIGLGLKVKSSRLNLKRFKGFRLGVPQGLVRETLITSFWICEHPRIRGSPLKVLGKESVSLSIVTVLLLRPCERYSDFLIFAKFETWNIPYIRIISCQNCFAKI